MAVPTFSPEGRMIERLRKLDCAESSFAKIVIGIAGKTRIAEAFKDSTRGFDNDVAEKLLDKIVQMEELQKVIAPIPIAWERTEEIRNALTIRLAAQTAHDLCIQTDLSSEVEWAVKQVTP